GLVLPSAVALLFLFWAGQLQRLLDWRLLAGMLAFGLVMVPWYAWVGAETHGNFLKGFFLTHNVDRFLSPMEGHAGNPAYYFLVLIVGFAPWSAFLGLALWYSLKFHRVGWVESSRPTVAPVGLEDSTHPTGRMSERASVAFLWCWIVVYFAFFSAARTKLPNYILPIYPAIALLTARFLERWRRGAIQPPAWTLHVALVCFALVGAGTIVALLLAGGVWSPRFLHGRHYPGLEKWALAGAVPLLGAAAAWRCLWKGRRTGAVISFAASGIAFLSILAARGAG